TFTFGLPTLITTAFPLPQSRPPPPPHPLPPPTLTLQHPPTPHQPHPPAPPLSPSPAPSPLAFHLPDTPGSQVTPELLAAEDLSGFTIQQIIQRSEVLDREKEKEEQEKKRIEEEVERNRRKLARRRGEDVNDDCEGPAASAPASNTPPGNNGGGVFAPQVTVIDGRIVVNEASLTVDAQGGRDDAMEGYKRVEESSARLNYGTHMKREKSDRWSVDETTQWYQALQQFGTDFEMLQALFPKRSRRQMKAKFKREETLHPHLVTHALTHRCTDVLVMMKAKFKREETLHPHLVTHALTHRCTAGSQGCSVVDVRVMHLEG
ncbi:unnamed protein product, partial [Closterium sp. NIES-54]